jgi:hypothetical protein
MFLLLIYVGICSFAHLSRKMYELNTLNRFSNSLVVEFHFLESSLGTYI